MTKNKSPCGKSCWCFLIAFVAGVMVFGAANLTMSATDEAAFCASCHVMSEEVWTHKESVHAEQACNECHLPRGGSGLFFKARSGINDFMVNTLKNVPDRFETHRITKDVIQANCVRCHYATVEKVNMTVKPYCTDCHRAVPHLNKMPIDRRKAADV